MKFEIVLPKEIEDKARETGQVQVVGTVEHDGNGLRVVLSLRNRLDAIKQQRRRTTARSKNGGKRQTKIIPQLCEQSVISSWNRHAEAGNYGNRNQPASIESVTVVKAVRSALQKKAQPEIEREIANYFACCDAGGAQTNGANYSYGNMVRFLEVMTETGSTGGRYWWNNGDRPLQDKHPKKTQFLADEFAARFLAAARFKLDEGSSEWRSFVVATDHLLRMIEKHEMQESFIDLMCLALDCLEEQRGDYPARPSKLASSGFWTIEFPQYLQQTLALPDNYFDEISNGS